jgi:predicted AAA+ superfamily ATPase
MDIDQEHRYELPPKVREADYRRKLELAYPFHPDVIDILYEKWGTFSSFQRTRGVLRLLANVVEDLYQSERNLDFPWPERNLR